MAITVIDGDSGAQIEFPDGTPSETIQRVMRGLSRSKPPEPPKESYGPTRAEAFQGSVPDVRAQIASLPAESRNAALKEWAKTRVARDRAQPGGRIADVVYNLSAGTPVGSWLDEAEGVLQGGLHKLSGGRFGAPYDEAVELDRARMAAVDADSRKLGSVGVPFVGPVDVTVGGLTKLAGGLASAPLAPAVRAMQGTTMLPSMVNAAANGMLYGGLYGSGEGETLGARAQNSAIGAGLGGAIGGGAAVAARGLGRVLTPDPRPAGTLAGLDRRGVGFLADDVAADGLTAGRAAADVARLGPEATLADLGSNVRTTAGAIARTPGEGRTTVVDTLGRTVREGRRGGADARIQGDLDAALGPSVDAVALTRQRVDASSRASAPLYDQAYALPVKPTEALHGILDRAEKSGVFEKAAKYMAIDGFDPKDMFYKGYATSGANNSALNMRYLDYIKKGIDGLAGDAFKAGDREAIRRYSALARQLRDEVDGILSPGNPGQSVYAQARAAAAPGLQFEKGVEQGRDAFSRAYSADQMRFDLARLRPAGREGFGVGGRDAIRQQVDNSASMFGATGDAAAMRLLNTRAARDKIQQLAGPEAAERIGQRLNTEAEYELTRQAAVGNSVTAEMTAAQRRMGLNTATPHAETLTGLIKAGAKWAADKMVGGYRDERLRRMTADMARVLMAQGGDRDALVRDLLAFSAQRGTKGYQRMIAEDLLNVLGTGTRPLAVEGATVSGGRTP